MTPAEQAGQQDRCWPYKSNGARHDSAHGAVAAMLRMRNGRQIVLAPPRQNVFVRHDAEFFTSQIVVALNSRNIGLGAWECAVSALAAVGNGLRPRCETSCVELAEHVPENR